jgi:hypothetical protein
VPAGDQGTATAVAGSAAAAAAVALTAFLLLLAPARGSARLHMPSPFWGSTVLLLSIERPG